MNSPLRKVNPISHLDIAKLRRQENNFRYSVFTPQLEERPLLTRTGRLYLLNADFPRVMQITTARDRTR